VSFPRSLISTQLMMVIGSAPIRKEPTGCAKAATAWIIEKRPGGELLRTWTVTIAPGLPDNDRALAAAWARAAYL
jgi:hypothetical protein